MERSQRTDSLVSQSCSSQHYRAIALPQGEHRANFPNFPTGSSGIRALRSPEEHYQSPKPTRDITTHAAPVGTISGSLRSQEQRSALDRLADSDLRDHLPRRRTPSASSGRLQDVEIMYDGDVNRGTPLGASLLNAISPTVEDTEHNSARAPATQRLGGLATLGSRERTKTTLATIEPPPTTVEPTASKAIAKRRVPATRKRVVRSPLQALKKKKVIVPKALPQRKRICTEKGTSMPCDKAGPSNKPTRSNSNSNTSGQLPTRRNLGAGFRSPPPSLP